MSTVLAHSPVLYDEDLAPFERRACATADSFTELEKVTIFCPHDISTRLRSSVLYIVCEGVFSHKDEAESRTAFYFFVTRSCTGGSYAAPLFMFTLDAGALLAMWSRSLPVSWVWTRSPRGNRFVCWNKRDRGIKRLSHLCTKKRGACRYAGLFVHVVCPSFGGTPATSPLTPWCAVHVSCRACGDTCAQRGRRPCVVRSLTQRCTLRLFIATLLVVTGAQRVGAEVERYERIDGYPEHVPGWRFGHGGRWRLRYDLRKD